MADEKVAFLSATGGGAGRTFALEHPLGLQVDDTVYSRGGVAANYERASRTGAQPDRRAAKENEQKQC